MQTIYFGTIIAVAIIYCLMGLLLLSQRLTGERSRMILATMTLLSMCNYIWMVVDFMSSVSCSVVMEVSYLLLGLFFITAYILYAIEVISPGWLTWRRLAKTYLPVGGLMLVYLLTRWVGVEYTTFQTTTELVAHIGSFQVIFRTVLALLMFVPLVLIYFVPYTLQYCNTNRKWINGYVAAITINTIAYLLVNLFSTYITGTIYIIISLLCSLYITYQELYVKLIRYPKDDYLPQFNNPMSHVN